MKKSIALILCLLLVFPVVLTSCEVIGGSAKTPTELFYSVNSNKTLSDNILKAFGLNSEFKTDSAVKQVVDFNASLSGPGMEIEGIGVKLEAKMNKAQKADMSGSLTYQNDKLDFKAKMLDQSKMFMTLDGVTDKWIDLIAMQNEMNVIDESGYLPTPTNPPYNISALMNLMDKSIDFDEIYAELLKIVKAAVTEDMLVTTDVVVKAGDIEKNAKEVSVKLDKTNIQTISVKLLKAVSESEKLLSLIDELGYTKAEIIEQINDMISEIEASSATDDMDEDDYLKIIRSFVGETEVQTAFEINMSGDKVVFNSVYLTDNGKTAIDASLIAKDIEMTFKFNGDGKKSELAANVKTMNGNNVIQNVKFEIDCELTNVAEGKQTDINISLSQGDSGVSVNIPMKLLVRECSSKKIDFTLSVEFKVPSVIEADFSMDCLMEAIDDFEVTAPTDVYTYSEFMAESASFGEALLEKLDDLMGLFAMSGMPIY